MKMKHSVINIDKQIMSGVPVFAGTRVPIQILFDYIEAGHTVDDFLKQYPWIKKEHAVEVIGLAKKSLTDEKVMNYIDENIA